jgi:uncharacterized protein YjbI with pentapeptide repeats
MAIADTDAPEPRQPLHDEPPDAPPGDSTPESHGQTDPYRPAEIAALQASAEADKLAASAQRTGVKWQAAVAIIQALATIAAFVATWSAWQAVQTQTAGLREQQRSAEQTERDQRLGTAMSALTEGEDATAKIGGLTLLVRNIEERVAIAEASPPVPPNDPQEARAWQRPINDAVALYSSSLDLLETYLRNPEVSRDAPIGVGAPTLPPDVGYAVNRLQNLMSMAPRVVALGQRASVVWRAPTIDLSTAQLYGTQWRNVSWADFGNGRRLVGSDLRTASFRRSNLAGVKLTGAQLQCADFASEGGVSVSLQGTQLDRADLRGADLHGADLSHANLRGADLRGANLDGALLDGAQTDQDTRLEDTYGNTPEGDPGLGPHLGPGKVGDFSTRGCAQNGDYSRGNPGPAIQYRRPWSA